jgi:glutaredoxin
VDGKTGLRRGSNMKTITMFHIEECRYCDFAKKAIAELREEDPEYQKVEIEMINENEHPEIIENYDYWSVPSLFIWTKVQKTKKQFIPLQLISAM